MLVDRNLAFYLLVLLTGFCLTSLAGCKRDLGECNLDGMTAEDQVTLLAEAVKAYPKLEQMYADMRAAYVKRDLNALVAIGDASLEGSDPAFVQRFKERVIHARNQRMAERLQPDMKAGGSFVAVGALHLAGKDGLVALLRKQGYKVTAVY